MKSVLKFKEVIKYLRKTLAFQCDRAERFRILYEQQVSENGKLREKIVKVKEEKYWIAKAIKVRIHSKSFLRYRK